jgi:hypothetical protein
MPNHYNLITGSLGITTDPLEAAALVLDTAYWGASIPGAVGLWGAGVGGSTSDGSLATFPQ